jgi:hypothetical protein
MTSTVWPDVLSSTLSAVYRAVQADPMLRRAHEIAILEAQAYGGNAEDARRAIEVWAARGCLVRVAGSWRITDRGRDEAKRLINQTRREQAGEIPHLLLR